MFSPERIGSASHLAPAALAESMPDGPQPADGCCECRAARSCPEFRRTLKGQNLTRKGLVLTLITAGLVLAATSANYSAFELRILNADLAQVCIFELCFLRSAKHFNGARHWGVQAIEPSLGARHQDGWERPQTCQPDKLARGSRHNRQPLRRLAGLFWPHRWPMQRYRSMVAFSNGRNWSICRESPSASSP